jgi:hypothetical protein
MHLTPGAQVCFGCGLPLGAEATPLAAPAIEAVAPPAVPAADNPWRQPADETAAPVAAAPTYGEAPVAAVPTYGEAPVAEAPAETEAEAPAPRAGFAERSQAIVATELATPAKQGPLLAFDPLPPVATLSGEDPYVTDSAAPKASRSPRTSRAVGVEVSDTSGTVRGIAHSTEDTLAVPAAYATFAPEAAQPAAAYQPESGEAAIVTLDFPAVLTVAPPQAPVAGWSNPTNDPYVNTPAAQAR